MEENNELKNRFMLVNAPESIVSTPTSTPTSSEKPLPVDNENIGSITNCMGNRI